MGKKWSSNRPQNPASQPFATPASSPSSSPPSPEAQYNLVYEKLVEDDDDIVGQLAYCLYKQSKQQYLQAFVRRNHRRPTDGEVRNHVDCAELPALGMYKEKATRVVAELLAQAAQEKQDELEQHFKDRLWQFMSRHQPETLGERAWHLVKGLAFGGLGGVVGNFMTTIAVLFILFFAASSATRDDFSTSARERLVSGLAEVIGVGISINSSGKARLPEPPDSSNLE